MRLKAIWNDYKDALPCMLCMFGCGLNEAGMFAVFWAMQDYYRLTYKTASLVFLTEGVGFLLAAFLVDPLTRWIGRTPAVLSGGGCQVAVQAIIATTPPFAVIAAFYGLFGAGWAIVFSHMNAYSATLPNSGRKIFLLHGGYGLGSLTVALIATVFLRHHRFSHFFAILAALTLLNLLLLAWTFRTADRRAASPGSIEESDADGIAAKSAETLQDPTTSAEKLQSASDPGSTQPSEEDRKLLRMPRVYLYSGLFFLMVGGEHCFFAFAIRFLLDAKGGTPSCGYVLTAFMACHALARLSLNGVTRYLGPKNALLMYQVGFLALSMLIWRLKNLVAVSACIALLGICIGPMVPSLLCDMYAKIPSALHVQLSAFVVSWGMVSAGLCPFIVGAFTTRYGIIYTPVIAAVTIVASLLLTFCLTEPRQLSSDAEKTVDQTQA